MKRLVPLLLMVLVLSACKIRFDASVVVNEDETGTLTIEISADEELRSLLDQNGGGDLTLNQDVPEGWETEEFTDGEFEGARLRVDFSSFDDLRQELANYAEVVGADDNVGPDFLSQLEITREGDIFSFSADLTGLEAGLGAALDAGGDDSLGIDPSAFIADIFEIRLVLTLPGEIVSSNADATAANTLTWNLGIADDGRILEAQSDIGGGGGGATIGLIVLIAVVLIVGIVLFQRSRQGGRADAAVTGAPDQE